MTEYVVILRQPRGALRKEVEIEAADENIAVEEAEKMHPRLIATHVFKSPYGPPKEGDIP